MKMSTPAPQAGTGKFRPTALPGGLEEARVLDNNVVSWGFGFGASHGLGNDMEGRWALGGSLTGFVPFGLALNPSATSKYMVMKSGNMTVAAMGMLGLNLNTAAATPFDFAVSASAPMSFWKMGPGDLHVEPRVSIPRFLGPLAFAAPLSFIGVTAGYSYQLTPKVTLVAMDTLNLAFANTLSLGGRIAFSDNLSIDVIPVTLTGATLTMGALSVGGVFGTNLGDLIKGLTP